MELNGTELLARVRRLTNDLAEPYFLSDDELYGYLSAAEREFCEDGEPIKLSKQYQTVAGSSYITTVALSTNFAKELLAAWLLTDSGERYPIGLNGRIPPDYVDMLETGPPTNVMIGIEDTRIQVLPTPDAVYTIQIDYTGLPNEDLTAGSVPQIPERYHVFLPFGGALLAILSSGEEHYDLSRVKAISSVWETVKADAYSATHARHNNPGPVQFHGNDLW